MEMRQDRARSGWYGRRLEAMEMRRHFLLLLHSCKRYISVNRYLLNLASFPLGKFTGFKIMREQV